MKRIIISTQVSYYLFDFPLKLENHQNLEYLIKLVEISNFIILFRLIRQIRKVTEVCQQNNLFDGACWAESVC